MSAAGSGSTHQPTHLTPRQAWEALAADATAVLVDVRTAAELVFVGGPDTGALPNRHLALPWVTWPGGERDEHFLDHLEAAGVRQQDHVLFICRSGHRSASAASAAARAGWARAANVLHGFEGDLDDDDHRGATGWRAEGLPWRQS